MQESEDLFIADPLPQRPPDGESSALLVGGLNLDNTMQSEAADRSALYDEEELDNMAREQYEAVSSLPYYLSRFVVHFGTLLLYMVK